jgi:hypothetical protein
LFACIKDFKERNVLVIPRQTFSAIVMQVQIVNVL